MAKAFNMDFTRSLVPFVAQDSLDFSKYVELSRALQEVYTTGSHCVKITPNGQSNEQTPGRVWDWNQPITLAYSGRNRHDTNLQKICELEVGAGLINPPEEVYEAFEEAGWMQRIDRLTPEIGTKYAAEITTTTGNPQTIRGYVLYLRRTMMDRRFWEPLKMPRSGMTD
jgi:hypothetical protein